MQSEKLQNKKEIKDLKFFKENDKWYEVNAIKKKTSINEIQEGQDVIIVIGENLNADIVGNYIGKHD